MLICFHPFPLTLVSDCAPPCFAMSSEYRAGLAPYAIGMFDVSTVGA